MAQCSEIFEEVFDSNCAGCVRVCECGRTYFNGDGGWDWEDGELENLRAQAESDPENCAEFDHSIGCMEIDGKKIV